MKRKGFIIGVVIAAIGIIMARWGDNLSTVTEKGIVQDHIFMPVGTILFICGLLVLASTACLYLFKNLRR